MALNKKILDVTLAGGNAVVYIPINLVSDTSFQVTHPNNGSMVVSVSNSTAQVNIDNPAQMATIPWPSFPITQPDLTTTYTINLADAQWASPMGFAIECLNFQYMRVQIIAGTGHYVVEQHINSLDSYVRED